jgi:hypothetical protein
MSAEIRSAEPCRQCWAPAVRHYEPFHHMNLAKLNLTLALLLFGCSSSYKIRVQTIPKGKYDIYVDNKHYGTTGESGNASVETEKIRFSRVPLLEIRRNDTACGFMQLKENDSLYPWLHPHSLNVYSHKHDSFHRFDVTFLEDIDFGPLPLTDKKLDTVCDRFDLGRKGPVKTVFSIIARDTNSFSYWGLQRHLEKYLEENGSSWSRSDSVLFAATSYTSLNKSKDSLSHDLWKECSKQGIKYLVLFFGFSMNYSNGISPGDAITALSINIFGNLLSGLTGFYVIAIPGSQSLSRPTVCCAVYSVKPNRCIFKAAESTAFSDNNDGRKEVDGIVSKLLSKVHMLIGK